MLEKILDYWYRLEFFNPCWPVKVREDANLLKKDLPWETPQMDSTKQITYDVYFGRAQTQSLVEWMLDDLKLKPEDTAIEKDNSQVCLCALKIDENGKYVKDSFVISSFVWAICKYIKTGAITEKLDIEELEKLQEKIEERITQNHEEAEDEKQQITRDELQDIYYLVHNTLGLKADIFKFALWSREKVQYANKKGEFPPLDPSTELLQSFYLKDMKKVQNAPTQKIRNYTKAALPSTAKSKRIQIDTDVEQMQKWLEADRFPLGAWPSKFSPSLMQQLGINLAIGNTQNVFSINGPPGTGKTTLLKEIVVSNVIQRAIVMYGYDEPEKAFTKAEIKDAPDQYSQTFYKIDPKLAAYGMIVASNNNAAVENISVELPKAIKGDRTGRFSSTKAFQGETYFGDVATRLLGEPAWGLISAKLGKKSNLKELKERIWWSKEGATVKDYFEQGPTQTWSNAKENFLKAWKDVGNAKNNIAQAQRLLQKQKKLLAEKEAVNKKYKKAQQEFSAEDEKLKAEEQKLKSLEAVLELKQSNIVLLKSQLSFLKRLLWKLFKNNILIKEWKQTEREVEQGIIEITRQRTAIQAQKEIRQKAEAVFWVREEELKGALEKLSEMNRKLKPYQELFGDNWADDKFWVNISENRKSQIACPWTYPEYDKLREELFYQALMLHKSFILSSNRVKQNIMRLFSMWEGRISANCDEKIYGNLLNTLMLLIPVISTTFASVQNFLEGVQAEELGILVVDEAGQATPQSALGALWRTKKAIIVGDPMQVEPIVTVPVELRKRFAEQNEMPTPYRSPELSVQVLADEINVYGGLRKINDENIWVGCPLVVHRRCLNPMFQISNEIAYAGKMFNEAKAPEKDEKLLLPKSVWVPVKGTERGNKNHTVDEQIAVAVDMVAQSLAVYEGLPKIYVITPFTTVATSLRDVLSPKLKQLLPQLPAHDISDWLSEHCGTIHTFQGKEANEVLLVLGCDAQTGKGAAHWVGQKPNIINVAASRAKFRIAVIGDPDLWKNIPYVQTAFQYLKL